MKSFIMVLMFTMSLFSYENSYSLASSLSDKAIVIGHGPEKAYVFVDPLCPKSRKFLKMISEREDLQAAQSYYIFLYRLEQFKSEKTIQYIYQADNPKLALEEVMIKNRKINLDNFKVTVQTQMLIDSIALTARQMEMIKRPYSLVFEENSQYCRVSEGTADCLEEIDFES